MRRPSAPLASIDYNMTHHIPAPAFAVCSPSGPMPTVQPRLLTPDMAMLALCNGVAHAHAVTSSDDAYTPRVEAQRAIMEGVLY